MTQLFDYLFQFESWQFQDMMKPTLEEALDHFMSSFERVYDTKRVTR